MYNIYAGQFILVWGATDTEEQEMKSRELRQHIYALVMAKTIEHRAAAYAMVFSQPTQSCAVIGIN